MIRTNQCDHCPNDGKCEYQDCGDAQCCIINISEGVK